MPTKTVILCDRCKQETTGGLVIDVERVIYGHRGEEINVNEFSDITAYAVCPPCGNALRLFLRGVQ